MNKRIPLRRLAGRRATIIVILAVGMSVFVTFSAVAINVSYMQLARTEMRTAVDSAAKAAGQKLNSGGTEEEARQAAISVAAKNKIAGRIYELPGEAVIFGRATRASSGLFEFAEGMTPVNAVRVEIERSDESGSGAIPTFFSGLLGVGSYRISSTATCVKADRDIALVVDRSGSMMLRLNGMYEFPAGRDQTMPPHPVESRWAALLWGYYMFEWALSNTTAVEKLSLATYATDATEDLPLTTDYSTLRNSLDARSSAPINGWTNLGDGMTVGIKQLTEGPGRRFDAVKTMVVLTDGLPNVGRDPIEVAREAADKGIIVHTICFGQFADSAVMQDIAQRTGGTFYLAPDEVTLKDAFRSIADDLPVRLIQ